MARVFLDTNYFIDTVHRRPELQILDHLVGHIPYISTLSFHIYCYAYKIKISWSTYANKKYAYSIDYPSGWATIINVTGNKSKETLEDAQSLDIFDGASQKSYPDGVMTITWRKIPSSLPDGWNESETSLNGIQVKKFEGEDEGLHKETYVIPSDDGVIETEVRYAPGDPIKQTFDTMLASFQFNR